MSDYFTDNIKVDVESVKIAVQKNDWSDFEKMDAKLAAAVIKDFLPLIGKQLSISMLMNEAYLGFICWLGCMRLQCKLSTEAF